jgi:hypothetical protein
MSDILLFTNEIRQLKIAAMKENTVNDGDKIVNIVGKRK